MPGDLEGASAAPSPSRSAWACARNVLRLAESVLSKEKEKQWGDPGGDARKSKARQVGWSQVLCASGSQWPRGGTGGVSGADGGNAEATGRVRA